MSTKSSVPDEQPVTTSGTAPLPPTETSAQANERTIKDWLKKRYLTYDLDDGMEAVITIEEFLDIVQIEIPDCLMPEQTLTLALELCVKDHKRSNTLIVSDVHAQRLYALGVERETRAEVSSELAELQKMLLDTQKRWIIIPCNDGVIDTERIASELVRPAGTSEIASDPGHAASTSTAPAPVESTPGSGSYGTHWGLLIIDKTNKIARWVDSLTRMERVKTPDHRPRWRFAGMHRIARAAGKTLRGFEMLLGNDNGFPQGGFRTGTLRWNPNQWADNVSTEDEGACGPFVIAFLDHIMARASTLDRVGVRRMFSQSSKGRIRFNSVSARYRTRTLIQREIERRNPLKPGDLPLELNAEILKSLISTGMPAAQIVDQVQQLTDVRRGRRPVGPNRRPRRLAADDGEPLRNIVTDTIFLQAFADDRRENPEKYKDISNEEAVRLFLAEQQSMESGGDKTEPNKTEFYLGRELYRNVPLKDEAIWPAHESDIKYPKTYSRLPNFTNLTQQPLQRWLKEYPDIKSQINPKDQEQGPTACALLHHRIYRTFLGQTDDDFEGMWSKDKEVFDIEDDEVKKINAEKNAKIRFGMMRLRMMQHYQGTEAVAALLKSLEKYRVKAPTKRKKGKDGKDGDDDKASDKSDSDSDNDKPDGTGGREGTSVSESAGDLFSCEYISGFTSSSDAHSAVQNSAAFKAIASQTIDFASMDDHHVAEWVHRTASLNFTTERMSIWYMRACLQRAFGGFDTTSKAAAATYNGHLGLGGSLGFDQIINALVQATDNVPNLREQSRWYPLSYLREHGVIPIETEHRSAGEHVALVSSGSGTAGNEGSDKRSDGKIDHSGRKDKSGASSSLRTPGPDGLLNFRTMTGPELAEQMTPAMLNDARLAPIYCPGREPLSPNIISWRALCFVDLAGGRFENENDADVLELWAQDPIVFSRVQREMGYDARFIREMMGKHYYRRGEVDDDLFAAESDDDTVEDVDGEVEDRFECEYKDADTTAPPVVPVPAPAPADTADTARTKRKRATDDAGTVYKRRVRFAFESRAE